MTTAITGSCFCKTVQYRIKSAISMAVNCHCNNCKKISGGAFASLAVVREKHLEITSGEESLATYQLSENLKKHFCSRCGTKLFLTFERFPGAVGVYGGTFDDPNWYERSPVTTKHIFLSVAMTGTMVPAGFNCFDEHAMTRDGIAIEPHRFEAVETLGPRKP